MSCANVKIFEMYVILLQILTLFFVIKNIESSLTVEYYSKLIKENIQKAQNYTLPHTNQEFRKGYESTYTEDFGAFDFIIVGAGSAGSVVATRLSEISSWKILLLEAGGEENDFSVIPKMNHFLKFSEMNWGYYSVPQKNCCLGMMNQQCEVPRGKSIGGCSAINGLVYARGIPRDYNKWEELGNLGWSYQDVLPYFIKSENSQIDGDFGYHGTGGFWNVENLSRSKDGFPSFIEAMEELNSSLVDYNGQKQIGVSRIQSSIMHGRRQSTGTAFLDKARRRGNLRLVPEAIATNIFIDKATKTARGVEFVKNDKKFKAKATKEIILCGGAINSPQLLMLSGIGPRNHLEQIGIEVIEDLPVGKYLKDHPFMRLPFQTNFSVNTLDLETQIEEYLDGFGDLTVASGTTVTSFVHPGNFFKGAPKIHYFFLAPGGVSNSIAKKLGNFNDNIWENYMGKIDPKKDFQVALLLLSEKSSGAITLKSKSPIDFPNIDFNFFSEPEDIDDLIEGIDFILKLVDTSLFRKINARLLDIPICTDFGKFSRDFWTCVIKHLGSSGFHIVGTARMGPDKRNSVVDTNLKVHGIEKLRVVDASVFPTIVSGNTNAPTVMVAEKISDFIKLLYGIRSKESLSCRLFKKC